MDMPRSNERHSIDDNRRTMLGLLGGTATVGLAGCSAILDDDEEAENGDENGDENGEEETGTEADKAQRAWERVVENPDPEDEDIRNEAYLEIEEAVRDSVIALPLFHNLEERFWYDWVDVPETGLLGAHHQQYNTTTLDDGSDELNLINATFDEFDPIMSTDTASSAVINNVYETLTSYPNGVAELENQLLEEFEVSDDSLTWTFTIKDDVEFHGGEELTADDFVYSWRRLIESENSERANFALNTPDGVGIEHDEEDGPAIEALDDHTFEIELTGPTPGVLDIVSYSGFAVIPEGLVGDIDGYDGEVDHDEFRTEMANGTGPFEYDEFTLNEEVRLTRNDDYHGEVADLEAVHWEIIEDDDAAYTYAMEENADIFGIPTAQYDPDLIDAEEDDRGREIGEYGPLENDETANYLAVPELSTFYFGFNADRVPQEVRQAVAYVTDHEELVQDVFAGRGVEAFSFLPPALMPMDAEGYDEWVDNWPYSPNETDVQSAEQVLQDAGYSDTDPFSFTITTYEGNEPFAEAAEQTRDALAGSPVDIDLEQAPFATLQSRGEDGDLEMFSLGWIWSWEDPAYGHFGFEPKNTDTELLPTDATGYYLDWQVELEEEA